jgi:hypothetical protein
MYKNCRRGESTGVNATRIWKLIMLYERRTSGDGLFLFGLWVGGMIEETSMAAAASSFAPRYKGQRLSPWGPHCTYLDTILSSDSWGPFIFYCEQPR